MSTEPVLTRAQGHGPADRRPADDRRGRAADARRRGGHRLPLLPRRRQGPRRGRTGSQPTVILQDLVMPDIDGLTLVKTFRGQRADPRDADDRALDQGGADGQGRGVRPGGQRLHRQASRPPRAPGPDPLSLQGLHRSAPAQRGLPGAPGEPAAAGQRDATRRPNTCSRSCPRSSRRGTSGPTGGSSPRPSWGATRSATTGSTTTISPSTCWTSAATASARRCSRSRP